MAGQATRGRSGRRGRPVPAAELDWADFQVTVARDRVKQLAKLVEDETRRENPTGQSRALLVRHQQLLYELVAHRDAVFFQLLRGKPTTVEDGPGSARESAAEEPRRDRASAPEPTTTPSLSSVARHFLR